MNGKDLFNDTGFSNYLNNLFIAQSEQVKVSEEMSWLRERRGVCMKKPRAAEFIFFFFFFFHLD